MPRLAFETRETFCRFRGVGADEKFAGSGSFFGARGEEFPHHRFGPLIGEFGGGGPDIDNQIAILIEARGNFREVFVLEGTATPKDAERIGRPFFNIFRGEL